MNDLTLVQQYLLCAVSDSGKLTNLHSERMICFLAGGLLTLELAGCVAPAEKKKVSVAAPLPEALDDLRPMYDFIAQKGPVKPEKVAEEFYLGMTSKKFDQLFNAVGNVWRPRDWRRQEAPASWAGGNPSSRSNRRWIRWWSCSGQSCWRTPPSPRTPPPGGAAGPERVHQDLLLPL